MDFCETTIFEGEKKKEKKKKLVEKSLLLGVLPISVLNDKSICTITALMGIRSQ